MNLDDLFDRAGELVNGELEDMGYSETESVCESVLQQACRRALIRTLAEDFVEQEETLVYE